MGLSANYFNWKILNGKSTSSQLFVRFSRASWKIFRLVAFWHGSVAKFLNLFTTWKKSGVTSQVSRREKGEKDLFFYFVVVGFIFITCSSTNIHTEHPFCLLSSHLFLPSHSSNNENKWIMSVHFLVLKTSSMTAREVLPTIWKATAHVAEEEEEQG